MMNQELSKLPEVSEVVEVVAPRVNFTIYSENLEKFESKMKMLTKKSVKIGNGNIGYKVTDEEFVKIDDIWHKMIHIEITGSEVPRINGWEFVATIDHMSLDNGNIINKIPTFEGEIPERFRTTGQYCEHCNSYRRRNDTYILFNESTGEFKQIGKNCLKDFLGHNSPEHYARYAEYLMEMKEQEEELCRGLSNIPKYTLLIDWVAQSQSVIRTMGYVSRSNAEEFGKRATTDEVYEQMFEQEGMKEKDIIAVTQEDKDLAVKVIEYIKGIETKTDYEENLKLISISECIALRVKGYATSMIPYYMKAMELLKVKEVEIPSKHIGTVGQKIEVELTVEKVVVWENAFGVVRLHLMKDKEGNVFTWKTSSKSLMEGSEVKLKGTIQEHTEYYGANRSNLTLQTQLTRCKVL